MLFILPPSCDLFHRFAVHELFRLIVTIASERWSFVDNISLSCKATEREFGNVRNTGVIV